MFLFFSIDDELIQGEPALVKMSDAGLCTVAVMNCAPYLITIKQGSVIGLIEDECSQSKIETLADALKFLKALTLFVGPQPQVINGPEMKLCKKSNLMFPQSFDLDTWIF